jgi:cyanate lyase
MSEINRKLRLAISNHVAAEIDYSWMGSKEPASFPEIKARRKTAKLELESVVNELINLCESLRGSLEEVMSTDPLMTSHDATMTRAEATLDVAAGILGVKE